mmetsp:Transcript_35990/g.94528  ORF Transcript_35990/g.94528 Transcript_35990/m.94528 type:complete len:252 (+) Transcript_35990:587-1342(+)
MPRTSRRLHLTLSRMRPKRCTSTALPRLPHCDEPLLVSQPLLTGTLDWSPNPCSREPSIGVPTLAHGNNPHACPPRPGSGVGALSTASPPSSDAAGVVVALRARISRTKGSIWQPPTVSSAGRTFACTTGVCSALLLSSMLTCLSIFSSLSPPPLFKSFPSRSFALRWRPGLHLATLPSPEGVALSFGLPPTGHLRDAATATATAAAATRGSGRCGSQGSPALDGALARRAGCGARGSAGGAGRLYGERRR